MRHPRVAQELRPVGFSLHLMYSLLHLVCGSPKIDAEHANAMRIDFRPKAVGDCLEGVLRGTVLRRHRLRCNSTARIDEDDLSMACFQHRRQGLAARHTAPARSFDAVCRSRKGQNENIELREVSLDALYRLVLPPSWSRCRQTELKRSPQIRAPWRPPAPTCSVADRSGGRRLLLPRAPCAEARAHLR